MILEEETFEVAGYYPSALKSKSSKLVIAVCDLCGEIRVLKRKDYHILCPSCTRKDNSNLNFGKHFSDEHKAKLSESHKGRKNGMFGKNAKDHPMFGKKHTKETRAQISALLKGNKNHFGCKNSEESKAMMSAAKKGEKNPNFGKRGKEASGYKGGKKVSKARSSAKRKRQLGYTLLLPLAEGEIGHHITNEFVIGIPAEVHQKLVGRRDNHRAKILEWLKDNDITKYDMVLNAFAKESLK